MSTNDITSSNDPEAIRAEIERTRANLSRDVNALGEAASPGNVAKRQAEKVTDKATAKARGLKDKIMGSDDSGYATSDPGLTGGVSDRASAAGEKVSEAADQARAAVSSAPSQARARTAGNPLAAGLVALGAGWLLGSLLPASAKERELAQQAKEQAQPLVEEAKSSAAGLAETLKEPAQQAVAEVKERAQSSVETVKAEGQAAASDVKDSAKDSAESVKEQRS